VTRRRALLAALALALAVAAGPASGQCAMCRTALTQSPEGRAMASGFNRAIVVMLVAPYVVFGAGAALFFRRRRAARGAAV
jgi:hypothetical protein